MNVKLMTNDAVINQDAVNARAKAIAAAFLRDRWPDVICLNEVLDETARDILKARLSAEWSHVAAKFGPTRTLGITDKYMVIGSILAGLKAGHPLLALPAGVAFAEILAKIEVPDDAGLMVLSRFPIINRAFMSYADYRDTDSLADKGVAMVQVRRSATCVYNVFVTHMQASYAAFDEYRKVRATQLEQVEKLVTTNALQDFTTPSRAATIICGDMNIQGIGPARQEWLDVFQNGSKVPFFTTNMTDAWERFIAPGTNGLTDRGVTNRDVEHGWESRLDYVLLMDPPFAASPPRERRRFAVQRMFLTHVGLSDHIGVAAELNLHDVHCSPCDARDMSGLATGIYDQNLEDAGMAWLRFSGRGGWSLTSDEHTSFEVYLPDNMSQVLRPQYTTQLGKIPHAGPAWRRGDTPSLRQRAWTFVIPVDQFYVRVFRHKDDAGPVQLGYYRHIGTSPYDAVPISPQRDPVGLNWGSLSTVSVNPPMELWFTALVRRAVSGASHTSKFEVLNPTGGRLKLRVVHRPDPGSATDEEEWGAAGSADPTLQVMAHRPGGEQVFLQVTRDDVAQIGFTARWFSAMNYLRFDVTDPPRLECKDETGADWAGGDEISLEVRPDGFGDPLKLIEGQEDVNTDDLLTIKGLPNANWRPEDTGYVNSIEVKIVEDETFGDDEDVKHIPALPEAAASSRFEVILKPGTGEYRLNVQVGREP
ncbi:endonuclease/exonuclease/phosphatase family protein [Corallococcus terminator]